jgi:hypothetical protein
MASYVGGRYLVQVGVWKAICLYAAPTDPRTNGTYEFKAQKDSATDGSVYGLVFGLDNRSAPSQFYVFWVDPYGQAYALEKYDGGWVSPPLIAWTPSTAIQAHSATNTLKVRRQGARINLYVNGIFLWGLDDSSFLSNGYVGLVDWAAYDGASSYSAYFDDFKISVPTLILSDDFANPGSGWPVGANAACQADYDAGEYRAATQPGYACVYRAPAGSHPDGRFEIVVRHEQSIYPTAYGLVFGEAGDFSSFYTFWVIADNQEYALTLYNANDPEGIPWRALTWDTTDNDAWISSSAISSTTAINVLRAERDGGLISLWVNGIYLQTVPGSYFPNNGYCGVANWASSYSPVTAFFDDFKLTVWDGPSGTSTMAGVPAAPAAQEGILMTPFKPLTSGGGAR